MEDIGYIASIVMGVTLGVMGGGGSILTVPLLVYLFSLSPVLATAYSLFVVGVTALVGGLVYIRKGDVDYQAGFAFALPSVVGVNIARGLILPHIPNVVARLGAIALTKEMLMMLTFAALMVVASSSMIKQSSTQKRMTARPPMRAALIGTEGLFVGVVAGFVGAGGGFLIIPTLVFMAGLSMRVAVGTSLMVIAIQSLLGFAGDLFRGLTVDWSLLGAVTVLAIAGVVAGSAIAHKIEEQKLKRAFGWFVLVLGIAILLEQIRHLSS